MVRVERKNLEENRQKKGREVLAQLCAGLIPGMTMVRKNINIGEVMANPT